MPEAAVHTVYLGLGSNLGDKHANIWHAIEKIEELIGDVVRQSALYDSDPWGFQSDHRFVNAVVAVHTLHTPREVLALTQRIERQLGRPASHKSRRGADGKPVYDDRAIDIDILLYDDLHIDEPDLQVPHPLMHERDFVMVPLGEVMPEGQQPARP